MKYFIHLLSIFLVSFALVAGAAGPIDINTATASELAAGIKGVGPAKAAAIVEFRNKNGPFKSVDDLANVPGVGPKILESNKENLTVGGGAAMPGKAATPTTSAPGVPAAKPAMPSTPSMPSMPSAPKPPTAPAYPPTKTN